MFHIFRMISTKNLLFFYCFPYFYKEERHYFHPKRAFLISQTHVPSYHYKTLTKKYVNYLIFRLDEYFFQPSKCVCSLADHDFSGPSYCLYAICVLRESPVICHRSANYGLIKPLCRRVGDQNSIHHPLNLSQGSVHPPKPQSEFGAPP